MYLARLKYEMYWIPMKLRNPRWHRPESSRSRKTKVGDNLFVGLRGQDSGLRVEGKRVISEKSLHRVHRPGVSKV